MVCGGFREGSSKEFLLQDVEEQIFRKVLALGFGSDDVMVSDLVEAVEVGKLADRLQMANVMTTVEEMVLSHLTVEACADVLSVSRSSGLSKVEQGCREMALGRFEEVAKTAGFMRLNEETLGYLLDDDDLVAAGEEVIFEAVVNWMRGFNGNMRGENLIGKIRFELMDEEYLLNRAHAFSDFELVRELVSVASLAKHDDLKMDALRHLSGRVLGRRKEKGVCWEDYLCGGERRLPGHTQHVLCLAATDRLVCSASADGSLRVWSRASLEQVGVLGAEGGVAAHCAVWWEGGVVSGHTDGRLRVWDVRTQQCRAALAGHTDCIIALVTCGNRILSGSDDSSIRVWVAGGGGSGGEGGSGGAGGGGGGGTAGWSCERTMRGHTSPVCCLAVWEGRVLSGSRDMTIRVWGLASGAHERTLLGHSYAVTALAVAGAARLVSASRDGTIRTWALGGGWELLQTVAAYPPGAQQWVRCLAVGGGRIVTGSISWDPGARCEVKVWGLQTLECEHTLAQGEHSSVRALTAVGAEEVWGGVGAEVVVWGRARRPPPQPAASEASAPPAAAAAPG